MGRGRCQLTLSSFRRLLRLWANRGQRVGKIVGGFVVPHDPLIFVNPKKADRSHLMTAYAEVRKRIVSLGATSAIVIGADHYILFSPKCLPQILIGIGELHGPIDQLPGLPDRPIAHNEALANQIVSYAHEHGCSVAVSKDLGVDHAIGAPVHMCLPEDGSVATIPVYLASGVTPYVRLNQCYTLGGLLRDAVACAANDERVVVIGSGGISHWVGTGEMGRINHDFDKMVLDAIVCGDPEPLLALSDAEILRDGGNGGMEIRQFLTVMGAMPRAKGRVIAYDGWEGGVTGLGFAEILDGRG